MTNNMLFGQCAKVDIYWLLVAATGLLYPSLSLFLSFFLSMSTAWFVQILQTGCFMERMCVLFRLLTFNNANYTESFYHNIIQCFINAEYKLHGVLFYVIFYQLYCVIAHFKRLYPMALHVEELTANNSSHKQ